GRGELGPGGAQRIGDLEVAAADDAERLSHPQAGQHRADHVGHRPRHAGTIANARAGDPVPPTIGSGDATSSAPDTGIRSRFSSWVRPYLSAPSRLLCAGNGGAMPPAWPASMPTVSTPKPVIGESASHFAPAGETPGVCGPCSSALRNAAGSRLNRLHPVRNSSEAPAGSGPWAATCASKCSGSSTKSGLLSTAAVKSSTTAGPM